MSDMRALVDAIDHETGRARLLSDGAVFDVPITLLPADVGLGDWVTLTILPATQGAPAGGDDDGSSDGSGGASDD